MKIMIALQFWEGDRVKAMRLARLIADIEPKARDDVEFCFVRRFDTEPIAHDDLSHLSLKFKTHVIKTTTQWTGWPGGPNAMALDVLNAFKDWEGLDALLLIEPDCVPTSCHWLRHIMDEWESATTLQKWVMGSWRGSGGQDGHINGNCVVRPDLAKVVPLGNLVGPGFAWDCAIAPYIKNHWFITGAIKNQFQSSNATAADLLTPEFGEFSPSLVHGYKDDSAFEIGKMLSGVFK